MEVSGKHVTVMGLGSFGGGIGVIRWLSEQGALVTVTDTKPEMELTTALRRLADLQPLVRWHLGSHRERDFVEADLIVASPAVKPDNSYLARARAAEVPITSEMQLFLQRCPAIVFGVTGSNGKSTTTALIHHLLCRQWPRTKLGGNIGRSLLAELEQLTTDDRVVLELSSFQLCALAHDAYSPEVAVVTNLAPNHLDWHPHFEHYAQSKQQLLRDQQPWDLAVLNADDERVREWDSLTAARTVFFGRADLDAEGVYDLNGRVVLREGDRETQLDSLEQFGLPGPHNRANALAALAAVLFEGYSVAQTRPVLASFRGLEHRLEHVRRVGHVDYYNDSIATTPESTIAALESFQGAVILIAGGSDKGTDFQSMTQAIAKKAKAVILIGQTAETLGRQIDACRNGHGNPRLTRVHSLQQAVHEAQRLADTQDVVVLSPGCASYDMFRNFADRGQQFRECVRTLA